MRRLLCCTYVEYFIEFVVPLGFYTFLNTVLLFVILAFEATKDMQPSEQSNSERSVTPSTSDSSDAESETFEDASATERVGSSATTCPPTQSQETGKQHIAAQEEVRLLL